MAAIWNFFTEGHIIINDDADDDNDDDDDDDDGFDDGDDDYDGSSWVRKMLILMITMTMTRIDDDNDEWCDKDDDVIITIFITMTTQVGVLVCCPFKVVIKALKNLKSPHRAARWSLAEAAIYKFWGF